jgi:hypothetical protein
VTELIGYSILLVALLAHALVAALVYRKIHRNSSLTFTQKNELKLKALIFPLGLWLRYRAGQKG